MAENPVDVLLWSDIFWCFRAEYRPELLRDEYLVIGSETDQWYRITRNRQFS